MTERVKLEYLGKHNELTSLTRDIDFQDWITDLKQVGAYWAAKRIDDLLEQINTQGELPELVQSVVNLSIKHQILTPYTAFLVLETNPV
ncbi:hypothetical protein PTM75_15295, partial [Clostridium perfringens]|nr:hypothetical protein [Clostridium perfringens]